MTIAYVDTSCLASVALDEAGAARLVRRLVRFDALFSSNLLEAELRSVFRREGVEEESPTPLGWVSWVLPDRELSDELGRILDAGYLRGADLWHVACCMFLIDKVGAVRFVTVDERQAEMARAVGLDVATW